MPQLIKTKITATVITRLKLGLIFRTTSPLVIAVNLKQFFYRQSWGEGQGAGQEALRTVTSYLKINDGSF